MGGNPLQQRPGTNMALQRRLSEALADTQTANVDAREFGRYRMPNLYRGQLVPPNSVEPAFDPTRIQRGT